MNRRDFLRGTLPMGLAPLALNGIPMRVLADTLMTQSFSCAEINDRVLVLVQLSGGNDGLNTLIPLDQYATYRNFRPVIGVEDTGLRKYITLDSNLPSNQQIGLHPDMTGIKDLYDQGMAHLVQNVAYNRMNGSHFQGTDIWLSGLEPVTLREPQESGWFGRYLDRRFPNFPDAYPTAAMPDPPGLELGSQVISLGFHRAVGIPMGMTLTTDPVTFDIDISGVGGALPNAFPNSDYGRELKYLTDIERTANVYADRLSQAFQLGTNAPGVNYPETYHTFTTNNYNNGLTPQLKTVARLISGGLKTKVYLVRLTGFDTHGNQGIPGKPSFGSHSALLYHLSEAIRAFYMDLQAQGLAERVVTATFSEFGRQVRENGTFGTDHGTSAPMLIFGRGLKPGVSGPNPNLSNVIHNKLVGYSHDYRQVFATLLQDWMGANNGTLQHAEWLQFANQKLPLIHDNYVDPNGQIIDFRADPGCDPTPNVQGPTSLIDEQTREAFQVKVFPNPATDLVHVAVTSAGLMPALAQMVNMNGARVAEKEVNLYAGENLIELELAGLAAGLYVLQVWGNPGHPADRRLVGSQKVVVK